MLTSQGDYEAAKQSKEVFLIPYLQELCKLCDGQI